MTFWWKDVDVKKNTRVPREKFGRHSNPIYLVLKPLNKSGTAFQPYLCSPEDPKTPKFEFSTVPCLPCTTNMQNMHVNCKTLANNTMKNNEKHF